MVGKKLVQQRKSISAKALRDLNFELKSLI
ncbi:MAG: hypothetical protein MI751_17690 [Pseudomonadales bacterium]|jgi:3-phenylpropionate/trans-cinnamate dioxygenase ferredoxin reductase subunit|nr:hypothetical protein [Pseudomonadales bacterium]